MHDALVVRGREAAGDLNRVVDRLPHRDPAADRREGERFGRPLELSREAGDVLTTPLLPGLELALAWIFKD